MPTRPRLSAKDRCIAGGARGAVHEVLPKGYLVMLDRAPDGPPLYFGERLVKPESTRKKAPPLKDQIGEQTQTPSRVVAARSRPQPVHIPDPPEECEWWLRYVRTLPCCNCGRAAPSEAHHEGRKGVSQKCRDTLAVPLCAACHFVRTKQNLLPAVPVNFGETVKPCYLRTREDSLRLLQCEQERLLLDAMWRLDQRARIEVLSKAVAVSRCASK